MYTHVRASDASIGRLLWRLGSVSPNTVEGKVVVLRRRYHDESYGFRRVREFTMPDCMSSYASLCYFTHGWRQTRLNNWLIG